MQRNWRCQFSTDTMLTELKQTFSHLRNISTTWNPRDVYQSNNKNNNYCCCCCCYN